MLSNTATITTITTATITMHTSAVLSLPKRKSLLSVDDLDFVSTTVGAGVGESCEVTSSNSAFTSDLVRLLNDLFC